MKKFLLDVNLSPKTAAFLQEIFDFDVIHGSAFLPAGEPDEKLVELALRNKRIIITLDLDFGEIYYLKERGNLGVIVLRIRNQTLGSANKRLKDFFQTQAENIDLDTCLVVIDEYQIRVVRP